MERLIGAAVAVIGMATAGCQTTGERSGETPVTVTPRVAAGFEWYKNYAVAASRFAVSLDGKTYVRRHCQGRDCQTYGEALETCNEKAERRGSECRVFAVDKTIVWPGPVVFPDFGENGHLFSVTVDRVNGPGTVTYGGQATVHDDQSFIQLAMRAGSNRCHGRADKSTRKWRVACHYAESYESTFTEGAKTLYEGLGTSSRGRHARFSVFHKS